MIRFERFNAFIRLNNLLGNLLKRICLFSLTIIWKVIFPFFRTQSLKFASAVGNVTRSLFLISIMIIFIALILHWLDILDMFVMLNLKRIQIEVFILEVQGIFHRLVWFFRKFRNSIGNVFFSMVWWLVLEWLVDSHKIIVGKAVTYHIVGVIRLICRILWVYDIKLILFLLLSIPFEFVQIVANHTLCIFHPLFHNVFLLLGFLSIGLFKDHLILLGSKRKRVLK